jgi:hypothetical protein
VDGPGCTPLRRRPAFRVWFRGAFELPRTRCRALAEAGLRGFRGYPSLSAPVLSSCSS